MLPWTSLFFDMCGGIVTPTPYVRDIGVLFVSAMSMAKNVSRVCQMAYCQLRSVWNQEPSIQTFEEDGSQRDGDAAV